MCNGFTNLWIKAVLQNTVEKNTFYNRLQRMADYWQYPNNSDVGLKILVDKIEKLGNEIEAGYKNRVAAKDKLPLSEEE